MSEPTADIAAPQAPASPLDPTSDVPAEAQAPVEGAGADNAAPPEPWGPDVYGIFPEGTTAGHTKPARELTGHRINLCNEALIVTALDGPGPGGASHLYDIRGFDTRSNPSDPFVERYGEPARQGTILFQNGPIKAPADINGVTHEALLAILIDRFRAFQSGDYACDENRHALAHLEAALRALGFRARRRTAQGIEGTMAPDKA